MRNARRRRKRAQTGSSPCGFRAPAPAIYCAFSGRSRASEKLRNRRFCAARLLFLRGTAKLPKHSGRQIQQNGAPPRAGGTFCGSFKAGAFWQKRIPPKLRRKIFGICRLRVEAYVYPLARMHGGCRRDKIRAELPELPDAIERHASGNLRPRPAADEPYALGDVGV